ncbi:MULTISPECIES: 5-bromo-4-chloroindolyl phosphate hydrolysis family protein [unclassified Jeotgalibaca]|uniref:5-bromo-4-chloroindolyl phosphate hydrolysis family protein n=1 Tax=unclassified Jeotgalibaca TaxID=2621505 RepID=UPI003FCF46A4
MLKNIIEVLKFTFTNAICLIALILMYFLLGYDLVTSLILTMVLGAIIYYQKNRKRQKGNMVLNRVSSDKEAFYREQGLTKDEMNLFRNTMHAARNNIHDIEENVKSRTKLTAITNRNYTLPILKDFFKHIVEQPQRLHDVNNFLYTQLPNLKELTDNYVEVDSHVTKTKETYQSLDSSAKVIDALCQKIQQSYTDFMENDIDNMEIEIELAKQGVSGDNDNKKTVTEPSDTEI